MSNHKHYFSVKPSYSPDNKNYIHVFSLSYSHRIMRLSCTRLVLTWKPHPALSLDAFDIITNGTTIKKLKTLFPALPTQPKKKKKISLFKYNP